MKAVRFTRDVLPEHARNLSEAIDCPSWAARLLQLRQRNDVHELAAAEQELMQRVFRHVLRYVHPSKGSGTEFRESYRRGFPTETIASKEATCFSGPWLTAALLMEAGIPEEQLLYCNVFEDSPESRDWAGTHGALLLRTSANRMFFIDHGYRRAGAPFYIWMTKGMRERARAKETILGGSRGVHLMEMEDPKHAGALDLPSLFQLMPLREGIMSGHMLHVGIDFLNRGMLKEAAHAFDIGLTANPKDPDLHCYRGRVAMQLGDDFGALDSFDSAMRAYPRHLMTLFSIGEYWRSKGRHEIARNSFVAVAFDPRPIWGEGWIRGKAREYLGLPAEEQPGEAERFLLDYEGK
jgi:tetratricopeptide (TPR) repeat protein